MATIEARWQAIQTRKQGGAKPAPSPKEIKVVIVRKGTALERTTKADRLPFVAPDNKNWGEKGTHHRDSFNAARADPEDRTLSPEGAIKAALHYRAACASSIKDDVRDEYKARFSATDMHAIDRCLWKLRIEAGINGMPRKIQWF